MKQLIPDTLFSRLFLLLFATLTLSHFIGMAVFFNFGHVHQIQQPHPQSHEFRIIEFLVRLSGIALTAWIAARWLSRPIKSMAQATGELGKNLDSPPLDETHGPSEVQQASIVFNQMQARIKQQIAERSRFLAAVSHDLRTPLTRLKLRAEKIESLEVKAGIRNDIDEMTAMIDATLDYLRGNMQPDPPCQLDISALVHSLAENALEQDESVTVSGSAVPILVQPLALRRCLNNLIDNALSYGKNAVINLDDSAAQLVITIRDSGQGIPEHQLEAVFAPFYRLDESRSKHTGGVGLGLSIARDIALQQGGTLTLENAAEGGLIATLTLPRRS
ncbi:MAG: ATP-binding protein [Gallionellaceae bacterium]